MKHIEKQPISCVVCGFNGTCSPCYFVGYVNYKERTGICKKCAPEFYKGIKLFTSSSKEYLPLHEITALSKREYCSKWGLQYEEREHVDITCWQRVEFWSDALGGCEWLFFMGTDAMIMNHDVDCRQFLDTYYDLIIAKDVLGVNNDVFFMRSSKRSKQFLDEVLAQSSQFGNEQEAMIHLMDKIPGFKAKVVHQRLFNSYLYSEYLYKDDKGNPYRDGHYKDGDFVLHLPGMPMTRRIEIATEHLRPKTDVIDVHVSSSGLGDAVTAVYAACGAAKAGHHVRFHSRQAHWLSRVSFPNLEIIANNDLVGIDLYKDYGASLLAGTCRKQWYADNLSRAARIEQFPPIAPIINSSIKENRTGFDKYVMLAPFSAWGDREWPAIHWTRLAVLLQKEGYQAIAVDGPGNGERLRSIFDKTSTKWFWGMSPEWVMDAILGSQCVVGNDSGMAHLAGMLGVKTIAVHAQINAEQLWGATNVISIVSDMPCVGCAWQSSGGWTHACNAGCSALSAISPIKIMEKIML